MVHRQREGGELKEIFQIVGVVILFQSSLSPADLIMVISSAVPEMST